ncbi:hypothetical protein GWK47_028158 [Chionoecetes opilio]|uniref:Uncharacterized protein n=1 Tax=Chionoecetes opilio TaxID=41210 RepID=A0A8J5D679_CHIOP|nr:hypothetical protein GWK47_028158 [Chionoecetes opilio]
MGEVGEEAIKGEVEVCTPSETGCGVLDERDEAVAAAVEVVGASARRGVVDERDEAVAAAVEVVGASARRGVVDERDEAVAAAVEVVGASARRGVVALCASVAHIIRNNYRLQQQVRELEGQVKALQALTGTENTRAPSHCPSSLPDSPSAQRCGSAPPHFPAGSRGPGAARKASDPGSGGTLVRGHARASTGNLSRCGPNAASGFVRRKYSSLSLRRVWRTNHHSAGRTAASEHSSTDSLEQQDNNNNNNSKACIVTVAEVYSPPPVTTNSESDAVKLLAQKLTSVLQDDGTEQQHDSDNTVLCAPHPLAGCECVLCLQLAAHPDLLPYQIITDEGSLLPRGSTVLVGGRRVGTVVYFGHRKHQGRGPGTPQAPRTCEPPASPLGVTVLLWPPDEGEVFVPLNEVICQLDEEGTPSLEGEAATLAMGEGNTNTHEEENTATPLQGNTTGLYLTLTDPQGKEGMVEGMTVTGTNPERRPHEGGSLEGEDDLDSRYSECERGKLQFGDTWDSGCYMSLGRHSSEGSDQLSDLESEYGSVGPAWGSSLEEALNCVWRRHRRPDTQGRRQQQQQRADTFMLDTEVERQDYRLHGKVRKEWFLFAGLGLKCFVGRLKFPLIGYHHH